MVACEFRQADIVSMLLNRPGLDINEIMEDTVTPLYMASRNGDAKIVELLLKHPDIGVNKPKSDHATPLIIACVRGHFSVVQTLLKHPQIDVSLVSDYLVTALSSAHFWGHKAIFQLIQKFKENTTSLEKEVNFLRENLVPQKRFQDACGVLLEKIVINEGSRKVVIKDTDEFLLKFIDSLSELTANLLYNVNFFFYRTNGIDLVRNRLLKLNGFEKLTRANAAYLKQSSWILNTFQYVLEAGLKITMKTNT
jgi:hypothetical protein